MLAGRVYHDNMVHNDIIKGYMDTFKTEVSIPTLPYIRELIDRALDTYIMQEQQAADKLTPAYEQLWQTMAVQLRSGKRFRPYLLYLTYAAFDGQSPAHLLPVALAWELLHASLLIHDDIIDRDYVRHGIPNIAGQYQRMYDTISEPMRSHYANASALLGGDILLSSAHTMLMNTELSADIRSALITIFGDTIRSVAAGELVDMEATILDNDTIDAATIARLKTASYSFCGPLDSAGIVLKLPLTQRQQLHTFGEQLGITYQAVDDLLGTFGKSEQTGKPAHNDIREGKMTAVISAAKHSLSAHDYDDLRNLLKKPPLNSAHIDQVITLLDQAKARETVEASIKRSIKKLSQKINTLGLSPGYQAAFQTLLIQLLERQT
jgi:geranylgeranyl diphosphate synthase type II